MQLHKQKLINEGKIRLEQQQLDGTTSEHYRVARAEGQQGLIIRIVNGALNTFVFNFMVSSIVSGLNCLIVSDAGFFNIKRRR